MLDYGMRNKYVCIGEFVAMCFRSKPRPLWMFTKSGLIDCRTLYEAMTASVPEFAFIAVNH